MIKGEQLYELGWLPLTDLSSLQNSFSNLPEDTYAEKRLRSRRYSCYRYQNGALQKLSHKEFMQSKNINKAVGDVERKFEPIDSALETNPVFLKMFEEFRARTNLSDESVIEAHQIRWHCARRVKIPAPEGVHQDGFDYIAMFMVNSVNIDGGEIMIYPTPDEAPIFKKNLDPGEFVVLNDKKLFHFASPLVPRPNKDEGYWDLVVLTANEANA
ncbi:MAG: 2OG-Fe dioxygenase family protein [Alphaproteobacteria bacterium]